MTAAAGAADRGPSRTALGVAALRAFHQILDEYPKILVDPISGRLLEPGALDAMRAHAGDVRSEARRGLRTQVLLRSRFAEDRLAEAVQRGVGQCVILGAGLDTFAYRQPDWAAELRIFEVDHPASQADKHQRLARAGVATPANLDYVAVDFERVSLLEGLAGSRLDFSRPAFFSCLGVLVYLTEKAVAAIFSMVSGFPPGSEIVFTFSTPGASASPTAERAAAAGEPWRTHIDSGGLRGQLQGMGFSSLFFLGREEAEATYFPRPRRDGLAAPRRASIAAAMVG